MAYIVFSINQDPFTVDKYIGHNSSLQEGSQAFEDITSNLNPNQLDRLNEYLAQLKNTRNVVTRIKEYLDEGDITTYSPIIDENFPLYALLALKEGAISEQAFTTSQLFFNATHKLSDPSTLKVVRLFSGNEINPEALQMIRITTKNSKSFEIRMKMFIQFSTFNMANWTLSEEQIKTFFEKMQKLPRLEQQFLFVPDATEAPEGTPLYQIGQKFGFNVFGRMKKKEGGHFRVIPSKGMYQAFLETISETPCQLLTRFHLGTSTHLREEILSSQRELCLNFAFLPFVASADGVRLEVALNECEHHDFFHGVLFSLITPEERSRYYGISRAFKVVAKNFKTLGATAERISDIAVAKNCATLKRAAKMISNNAADMLYISMGEVNEAFFWFNVNELIDRADITDSQTISKVAKAVFMEIQNNAEEYKSKYDLTLEFLGGSQTPKNRLSEAYQEMNRSSVFHA